MRARAFPLVLSLTAAIAACTLGNDKESASTANLSSAVTACTAGPRPTSGYALVPALGDVAFKSPVAMVPVASDPSHFLVVEKAGVVKRVALDGTSTIVLDIHERVNSTPNEAGLLGMALHPNFADNGLLFLSFTKKSATSPANLASVLARGKSTDGGLTVDPASIVEMLSFDQPYANHNGGHLAFGDDGKLYASFGDGGSGGDPRGNGQNKDVFLGKILRIDVDSGEPYGIPTDNPFANGGGRPEIYAYGLRNTWRFNFDRLTGELWAGDVGQNKYEEVDKIVLGGNYGWGVREGFHCYRDPCAAVEGAIDPIVEYDHSQGFSITGGYVYRGSQLADLAGQYVFGDFGGKIWSIPSTQGTTPPTPKVVVDSSLAISSFAQDNAGELYVIDYGTGKIKRLIAALSSEGIPAKLSETGCFLPGDPTKPGEKLLPYDVNSPLWSDGAEKARWMALPPGGKITVAADGDFDFPNGTVLVKEFQVGGKRVETRLFVRHTDGSWAGYTYEWNATGTDALLLLDGKKKDVPLPGGGVQTWTYPSRSECMQCHNAAAGGSLGLEIAQLNKDFTYEGGATMNQLAKLEGLAAFAAPLPAEPRVKLADPADAAAAADVKARSYLHANCAFCHRPGAPGRGPADFRFSRSFRATKVCDAEPEVGDLGVAGAKLFTPGNPAKSIISIRTHATDWQRMPPIGSAIVDPLGTSVIDAWITSVASCQY